MRFFRSLALTFAIAACAFAQTAAPSTAQKSKSGSRFRPRALPILADGKRPLPGGVGAPTSAAACTRAALACRIDRVERRQRVRNRAFRQRHSLRKRSHQRRVDRRDQHLPRTYATGSSPETASRTRPRCGANRCSVSALIYDWVRTASHRSARSAYTTAARRTQDQRSTSTA